MNYSKPEGFIVVLKAETMIWNSPYFFGVKSKLEQKNKLKQITDSVPPLG